MKNHTPNTRWFRNWLSMAILPAFLSAGSAFAAISAVPVSDSTPPPPPDQVEARIQFSAGVPEILKMIDAKVEASVVLAFIDSSPTAYNPSASEIIILKDRGVSPEILAAMLKHGSEVRARAMASAPPPAQPTPNTAPPYAQSPEYNYTPPMSYSDYGYPSSSVYYYSYPSYYYGYPSYAYSYPSYGYWPSFYFGYYPYYYNRYPYFHRYPYYSFGHFGYRNHFTAFRNPPRFNGGFRAAASPRAPVTIGGHGGFRGGSFGGGGSFRGGAVMRGGGGFTAHAGGGGHMGGRMR